MGAKLMDITTGELLEKFGQGSHKPGSGSAAALNGMLSAKLMLTVIKLTNEPKRRNAFEDHLPELSRIQNEIEERIYPELSTLFQRDSDEFHKVITLRTLRNSEKNALKQRKLSLEADEALKLACEIPLQIASLCIELADYAGYIFDNGFRAARGDSGVALNSAVSSIGGCLTIVELNLVSLPVDDRTEKIRNAKTRIRLAYKRLSALAETKLSALERESDANKEFQLSLYEFREGNLASKARSYADIEKIVTRLQNTLWLHRDKIWKHDTVENPLQVLKPEKVLTKVLGYAYDKPASLGMYAMEDGLFEVAGLIDKKQKLVYISQNFKSESQNFTAAHELGHAILHNQILLHRDKQIDGSTIPKNREEMQADKFATYFLMPTRMVKHIFFEIFEMPRFVINENTALALRFKNIDEFRKVCPDIRHLARKLASIKHFGPKSFNSLAVIFGVSVETMAIRLEELGLVEF